MKPLCLLTTSVKRANNIPNLFADSRKLQDDDRPLAVQLLWQEDDREGRFLLKSDSEALVATNVFKNDENDPGQSFKGNYQRERKRK